jgi:holo-[acyl-carrier protein] synthase
VIAGIGTDIVEVYRIREALERTPRFLERVFTEQEIAYCRSKGLKQYESFAGRYAAKEALFKALGTGWRGELAWKDIDVVANDLGAPGISASGEVLLQLTALGFTRVSLSISHTEQYAVAYVIIES